MQISGQINNTIKYVKLLKVLTITAMYSLDIVSDLKAHDQVKCIGLGKISSMHFRHLRTPLFASRENWTFAYAKILAQISCEENLQLISAFISSPEP